MYPMSIFIMLTERDLVVSVRDGPLTASKPNHRSQDLITFQPAMRSKRKISSFAESPLLTTTTTRRSPYEPWTTSSYSTLRQESSSAPSACWPRTRSVNGWVPV